MKIHHIYSLILSVLLVCGCSSVQSNQLEKSKKVGDKSLEKMVIELLNIKDSKEQNKIIESIISANPSIDKVECFIKKGREYNSDVTTDWQTSENICLDGKSRPYHFYVPKTYNPDQKYPIIIFLHGGINYPELKNEEFIKNRYNLWADPEQEEEFIYIIPVTNMGAMWWTEAGVYHLFEAIEKIKQKYNVDENRIYVSGASDGGSGVYYLSLYHNTNFAGFISLIGHILVAQMGGQPIYIPNLRNKPIYVLSTGKDELYPAEEMKPFIEVMKNAGVPVTFKIYPDIGHNLDYWYEEKPVLLDFIKLNVRNPLSGKLSLETVITDLGRASWVQINEIKNVNNNADLPDYNVMFVPQGVRLGIYVDHAYDGAGVKINSVEKKSLAEKFNLQKDDIIIQFDDTEIRIFTDLVQVIRSKKPGDQASLKIKRNNDVKDFTGQFEKSEPQSAFNRDKTSGRMEIIVHKNKIEVKVKNISRYTLFISKDQFDINKEIEVYTNDKISFKGKVKPDLKFMLEQAGKDKDRTMVFWGKIEIEVTQK